MIWNVHPSVCLLETVIKDRWLKFLVKIFFSYEHSADLSVKLQNRYMYTVIYRFRDFIYILLWIVNICSIFYYVCLPIRDILVILVYFLYIHFIKFRIKWFYFLSLVISFSLLFLTFWFPYILLLILDSLLIIVL